jgi:AraC family transcriptional regulator
VSPAIAVKTSRAAGSILRGMDDGERSPGTFDPLERARAFIDACASETLTLEDVAAVAQLSAYHFARAFGARFGVPPMAYARERRMALAARRLAGARPPALVELAFDLGFESQEGFTRAFKRAHGVSPGRYRRDPPRPRERTLMPTIASPPLLTMAPAPVRKPAFRVAGVAGVFTEATKAGIPGLWGQLGPRLPLPGQAGRETYGVGWQAGEGGQFNYMAAVRLEGGAPAPDGFEAKDVPAQSYLVFRLAVDAGELHPQMAAATREIWGERVPNSGYRLARGPDVEFYPADFEPGHAGTLEWWIPVET